MCCSHAGETVIPGAGTRWTHLHRDGGSARGHPREDDPSAVADSAGASDDPDELPWQLIYIGDPGMVDRLRRQGRAHHRTVQQAIEGNGLPEIEGSAARSWEHEPPNEHIAAASADLDAADALWAEGSHALAVDALAASADLAMASGDHWRAAILRVERANKLRRLRRFAEAAASVEAALTDFPAFKQALHMSAVVGLDAGDPNHAIGSWSRLLKLDRKYPKLCDWLVRAESDKV